MRLIFIIFLAPLLSLDLSATAQTPRSLSSVSISGALAAPIQQTDAGRILSGTIISQQSELIPGVRIIVRSSTGAIVAEAVSDAVGNFRLEVPREPLSLELSGKNLTPATRIISADEATMNLHLVVQLTIPPVHESVVIVATQLDPGIERRNETIYRSTLFSRDDQLFDTLSGGINAGQHEGG